MGLRTFKSRIYTMNRKVRSALSLFALLLLGTGTASSQVYYSINFESGAPGWSTGNLGSTCIGSGSIGSTWGLGSTSGGGGGLGTNAYGTPNNGSMGAENSWIQSPSMLITQADVNIDFDSWAGNEGNFPCSYDVEFVEYSTNGGASWTTAHGYVTGLHDAGSNMSWGHITLPITVTPGSNVIFRFRYDTGDGCCGPTPFTGWYVDNFTVSSPFGVTYTETPVACFGGNNGSLTLTGSGGTPPYTYSINGGGSFQVSNVFTGLTAGTYPIQIMDATSAVTSIVNAVVTQPAQVPTPTPSSNTPVCSGNTINLSTQFVAGGTYSWTGPNLFTSTLQNPTLPATLAAAGTYSVTVTVGGCPSIVGTTSVVVTQTPAPTASSNTPVCQGSTINLSTPTVVGATYSWTGPNLFTSTLQNPTIANASPLMAGTYSVIVNLAGCNSAPGTTTVALQPAINITPNPQTNVSCFGGSNGAASVVASGGAGSFNYNWAPGIPTGDGTNSVTGLIAGTWTVTVTDANTCTANQIFTITEPAPLVTANAGQVNVICNGNTTGTATVSATGGTAPYTYLWSNGQTTATATGLAAGAYTATVTDALGCTAVQSFTITQPSALTVQASSQQDILCFGGTGTATVTIVGGTGAYTYDWTPGNPAGDGTNTVTGLTPGTYTITVTDANGCTVAHTFNFVQPALLTATPASQTNVSCNGGANGTATVTVAGGTGTKTYNWTPGNPVGEGTNSVSGLTAGTWTVTVTDQNNCVATQTFTITQPNALVVTPASQTNVLCNGAGTGAASVTATGGTGAYTYNWTPGNPSGDGTASVTGLTAGTWTVTVTDANLCSTIQTFTITQPNAIVVTPTSQTNVACNGGATGTASVSVTGGNGAYAYNWTPGNPPGDGTNSVTGLTVGTWTVTVTDANLCNTTHVFNITQQSSLVTSVSGQTNVSCFGGNNGVATVNVSGGTGPGTYTYSWTPGTGNAATVSGLSANTYTVTVTDANLCSTTQNVVITQPAILAGTQSQTNVTCNGANNGITTVAPTGGTAPYTYLWSPNGGTAATATGRAPGVYSVLVTDFNGCTMTKTYTITQPATLVASSAAQTNVSCFGGNNGAATVGVTGGTIPYTYSWAPSGGTAATASGLASGTYTVTVTDANLCTTTQIFNITQPTLLVASIASQTNVSCFGGSNGAATVSATGGTGAYTYSWSPSGGNAATASGLAMGTYVATITDALGCTATQTVNITQPTLLATSISSQTNVSCNGGSNGAATVSVTGGTGAYTYSWSPSGGTAATATGLAAGTYTLTATDANGCVATQVVNITQPAVLAGTPSQTNVSCNAANDGTATVAVTGGTTPYIYSWAPSGGTAATATGLAPGTYTVTVTDDNGCSTTNSYTITQPATLTASISSNVPCEGNTLNLTGTIAGGTMPYSYTWTGTNSFTSSSANPSITNVSVAAAGSYTLTVTDDNGCTAIANGTVVINSNALVTVQPVATTACIGSPAGFSVTATGTGLTYQWRANGVNIANGGVYSGATTNALSISDASGLNNTSYDVVVTGTCTTVTSAAAILGTPTTNTWTGIADTAWSNPMNWQCGNIPNIDINVVIPAAAPHMPLVDIPGAVAKSITVNAGASLAFVGTGNQVEVTGDITNLGSFDASIGAVKLSGNGAQSLPGGTYKQLKIDGSDIKSIQGNVTVVSNLMLTNGYVKLGSNSITMSSTALLTGGSDASYIITDGTGQVTVGNMGVGGNIDPVLFPVGTEDVYLPATISNAGTTDIYSVRVMNDVYDDYNNNVPTGSVITQNVVDKTWIITESADGGSNANIALSWTGAEELTGFINIECNIAHFNDNTNVWEPGVVGTATNNAGRFTIDRPNVTSFSPFSVRTEIQTNSVIKAPTLAYGLILYPNPVVDNKLYVRMSDQSLATAMDIIVVDMLGKIVSSQHYNAGSYRADNIEVNIGDVAAGNYTLKLKQEGAVPQAVKFIKR